MKMKSPRTDSTDAAPASARARAGAPAPAKPKPRSPEEMAAAVLRRSQLLESAPLACSRVERTLVTNFDMGACEPVTWWTVDDCPFCHGQHRHGLGQGLRSSSCLGGQYVLLAPGLASRLARVPASRSDTTTALYRHFAGDALLYVGITANIPRRVKDHEDTKPWWCDVTRSTVEHFLTRPEAEAAEKAAIQSEHPRYNIQHNRKEVTA